MVSKFKMPTVKECHDAILEHAYEVMPDPLPVPIRHGTRGMWVINTFTLSASQVRRYNLADYFNGMPESMVKPGTYTRLVHTGRNKVVMSNTPMEVITNMPFIKEAKGRVLISGLGLGMALKAVLAKPYVTFVKVIEIDRDLIDLITSGAFTREMLTGRLQIVHADALTYKPAPDEKYDVAWHDIWDEIDDENLAQMGQLKRKWSRRIPLQMCWAQDLCQRMKRRAGTQRIPAFFFE
jgi:hypothetical protein